MARGSLRARRWFAPSHRAAGAVSWSAPVDPLRVLVWGGFAVALTLIWLGIVAFPIEIIVVAIAILAALLIVQSERKSEETHAAMLARLPKFPKKEVPRP